MNNGKYICTCMECDYVWETDEHDITTYCPNCYQGDIRYKLNPEYAPQNDLKASNLNEKDEIV